MEKSQEVKPKLKGIFKGENLMLCSLDKQEIRDKETGKGTGQFYLNVSFTDFTQIVVMTCPLEFENLLSPKSYYNLGFNFSLDKKLKIVSLERL